MSDDRKLQPKDDDLMHWGFIENAIVVVAVILVVVLFLANGLESIVNDPVTFYSFESRAR